MPISIDEFSKLSEVTGLPGERTKDVALSTLRESESAMTQSELATSTGRREQHINRILHELLKDGLVERRRGVSKKNGRPVTYWMAKQVEEETE